MQREGLGLADLHAANGLVELLEHSGFADEELEGLGLPRRTARRRSCLRNRSSRGRRLRAFGGGALRERAALLAQDLDRLVDRGVVDLGRDLLDFGLRQVADHDLGVDLERGVEFHRAFGRLLLLRDARRAATRSFRFVRGGAERGASLSFITSYCTE